MFAVDKPRLRNTLKKLRAVEARIAGPFDPVETGQEMLDLLAVLAGLKPTFVHGRGLRDPAWIEGVLAVARGAGLQVVEGPCWNVLPPGESFPNWYVAAVEAEFAAFRPHYICKAPSVMRAVAAACAADGRLDVEQEARLLGYPACCVEEHHARTALYHRFMTGRIEELAEGDAARCADIYRSDFDPVPRNDDEERLLADATDIAPCPFASWNECVACSEDADSPSAILSDDYAALADAVDPALYDLLRSAGEGDGGPGGEPL